MDILLAGKVGLAVMLLFTALGHLLYTKGMMLMLSDFVPFKKEMIYGTGLMEFMAAIGLFVEGVN